MKDIFVRRILQRKEVLRQVLYVFEKARFTDILICLGLGLESLYSKLNFILAYVAVYGVLPFDIVWTKLVA